MRYGTPGSFQYKLLQRQSQILLPGSRAGWLIDSEVLLTVAMAISRTLVTWEAFLMALIHNGTGMHRQADLWLLINPWMGVSRYRFATFKLVRTGRIPWA